MRKKNRITKAIITLILSVMMVVSFIPAQFFAYAEEFSDAQISDEANNVDTNTESFMEEQSETQEQIASDDEESSESENITQDEDKGSEEAEVNAESEQKKTLEQGSSGDEKASANDKTSADKNKESSAGTHDDGSSKNEKTPEKEQSKDESKGTKNLNNPILGANDSLAISSTFELLEDGTYVMADAEQQNVVVDYSVEGPMNKVLVVEVPEYGVSFYESSLPSANNDIEEVKLINPHTFAMRLSNTGAKVELTNTFTMKAVKLTKDQAAYLIDNGMTDTRIAVSEYTYTGDLTDVVSQGTKDGEAVVWTGKPHFNSNIEIEATHTYKVAVTPISDSENPLTNHMFEYAGHQNGSIINYIYLSGYKSGEPRFKLPEAYKENGSLMEVTGIRFYVPDDRLKLEKIGNTENASNAFSARELNATDFTEQWGNWNISEEKTDDNGKKYYDITPGSRWFNVSSTGIDFFFGGMILTWKLIDSNVPLDVNADYLADNTVVSYKLPGSDELIKDDIRGSEVKTFDVKYRNISRVFNQSSNTRDGTYRSWSANSTDEAHDVISGSIYRGEPFVTILNDSYVQNNGTHWLPAYTGPVTQTYVFPYQIQPRKITISELGQRTYSSSSGKSRLSSITYTTYEGEEGSLSEETIQAANDKLNQHLSNSTFISSLLPTDKHIKKLEIKWEELATELRWYNPADEFLSLVYSQKHTARTSFDYKVNGTEGYTDPEQIDIINGNMWAGVTYSETYDGSINDYSVPKVAGPGGTERAGKTKARYFWFRIKPQLDPYLYGKGRDNDGTVGGWGRLPIEFMDDGIINIGNLGFYVGNYGERQDEILNPVIDLSVSQKKQSYDKNWGVTSCPRTTLTGITDDQLMSYLTGEFTAMPKLAGWTFEYTTKDHPEGLTYAITGEIPADGRAEKLPIADGDCFTSIKLKYEGYADLSHDNEDDTRTVIWMMKDIKVKRLSHNPFTGEEIGTKVDYSLVGLTLTGNTWWDNCICTDHQHDSDKTQWLIPFKDDRGNPEALRVLLYRTRKATYKETTSLKTTQIQNINQGGSTTCDFNLVSLFTTVNPLQGEGHYGQDNFASTSYPWGEVNEAVYVEIVDDEFIPNLSTTKFMGYSADSAQVISEVVTVDGKRFLKLRLADGVIYRNNVPHTDRATNTGTITDILTVGFNTLPGTRIGDHNPIGDIYYDSSLLLKKYDAPNKTGFDYDRTKYVFDSSAVEDTYDLSGTDVSGKKLFKASGARFTVHVDISLQAGVDIAPGKNESTYDFGTSGDPDALRKITYYPGEEDNLNALVTLKGPGNASAGSIYDMEAYVVLPRIGTDITWTSAETGDTHVQANEELDLYLRKAVQLVSNNDNLDVTVTYTTEDQPNSDSTYVAQSEITDWNRVTGIKIHIDEVKAQTAVNIRMDLRSDEKESLDVLNAYAGGIFRYKLAPDGEFARNDTLHLCLWKYDNISLKNGGNGSVFWDIYDENGLKHTNNSNEPFIKDVKLTLYDAEGSIIDTDTTNANGAFKLETYKLNEGQYIVIDVPTSGSYVAKLTKQSTSGPMNSNTDSDFDRTTNKLTLGKLTSKGMNNISAGFVRLPAIVQPSDVIMNAGETKNLNVLINEFVSNANYNANNILTNGGYKISFGGYDESLVRLSAPSLARNGSSSTQLKAVPTIAAGDKAGTTEVTVTLKNTLGDEVTKTFKITVNKLELHTEDYSGVYDGDYHEGSAYVTLNGTDKVTGAAWQYSIDGGTTWSNEKPSKRDVDESCTVLVKATYEDYGTVQGKYSITITPKPVTVTAGSKEFTYNGTAQNWDKFTVDGLVGNDAIDAVVTGSIMFPPESPVVNELTSYEFTTGKPGNYTVTPVNGELTMVNANNAITITAASEEWTYDGNPKENTSVTVTSGTLFVGDNLVAAATGSVTDVADTEEGNNPIATGYKIMHGTEDVTDNYVITPVAGTLTINPKDVTVTAGSKEFTYNGTAQSWDKFTVEGLVGNDTIDAVVTGSIMFPSESPVVNELTSYEFTSGKASNYTVTPVNGELTMVNANNAITITAATDEWTYDGDPHENTLVELTEGTLFPGDELVANAEGSITYADYNSEGNNPVAEGYKIMHGDEDVTDSYDITSVAGTLTINPAPLKITAKDQTYVYNGESQGESDVYYDDSEVIAEKVSADGLVKDDSIKSIVLDGDATEAGVYEEWINITDAEVDHANCYTISFVPGTLTIERAPVQIIYKLNGGSYNGSEEDIVEDYYVGDTITIHKAPEREGYKFLYWKGSEYYPGDEYTVELGGHVFTAMWEESPNSPTNPGHEEPPTGDTTNLYGMMAVFAGATLGLLAMIVKRRKTGAKRR